MTILLIERRVARHARAAEAAMAEGDREAYWQERRAMLAAQFDLWQATHAQQEPQPCHP